jgi:cobalt-zinc-cadmium efflux system outer membrane protein
MLDAELLFVEGGGGEIVELRAAQSLLDIVLIPIRMQVARERFERTKREVMGAILDLAAETRIQYRRLQAEEEMVTLLTSALDATWLSYEAARRLRQAGNIIELDVLRREAAYEELKIELARSRAKAHQLREGLNLLLGLWRDGADQWKIQPRLPEAEELDLDLDGLEDRVIEASLDLEAARREILALGHELNLSPVEAIFEEGSGGFKAEKEGDGTWALGPTAGLSIPLFNFGQAATEEGAARLRQAYERYTELAIRIRRGVRAAYVEAATSGANARYLREKILPLRSRITHQSRLQFNAMQIGVVQLLDSKRREIAAGRRYVETLRDHWVARTRLEGLLLGRLLDLRYGLEGGGMQASASAEASVESGGGH